MLKKVSISFLLLFALSIASERSFGQEWEKYYNSLQNFYAQGQYEMAIERGEQALELAKKEFGEKSVQFAGTQIYIAMAYQDLNLFLKAEPLYLEASSILKDKLGDGHPSYAASLFNLGVLYNKTGEYDKAEKFFLKAKEIYEFNYGKKGDDYARTVYNIAKVCFETEKYQVAEEFFKETIKTNSQIYDSDDMNYITPIFELAALYKVVNEYEKAEPLYEEIRKIYKKKYGENSQEYAHILFNLGELQDYLGKSEKAKVILKNAQKIYAERFGEKHQYYIKTLQRLARANDNLGNFDKAKELWLTVINEHLYKIYNFFPSLSEKEKAVFYDRMKNDFEEFNSFAVKYADKDPSLLELMYENQLSVKALLLNASAKVRRQILNGDDRELIEKFKSWIEIKEKIARFYSLPKERLKKSGISVAQYEKKAEVIERELSKRSNLFAKGFKKSKVKWTEIRDALNDGEAAIEIIRFRHYFRTWTDSIYYAALIIKEDYDVSPKLVLLKNGNELEDEYLVCYRKMIKFQLIDKDSYGAYWKETQKHLDDVNKIYISQDGVYNKINLVGLQTPSKDYLIDVFDIRVVVNTKTLTAQKGKTSEASPRVAVLFGDPEFDYVPEEEKAINEEEYYETVADGAPWTEQKVERIRQELKELKICELPETEKEVETITDLLDEKNWEYTVKLNKEATEENIKSIKSLRLLHIATHGYFLEDIGNNPDAKVFGAQVEHAIDNPLLRSGLLFAGASQSVSGLGTSDGKIDKDENGILTAYEAMNLNLEGAELVVLSACETGLGTVKNGEGVYGLQRAFTIAGAEAVIMSLWAVNDFVTRELMTEFYRKWLETGDRRKAFKEAQMKIKNKYRQPYFWAAFIMTEN